MRLFARLTAAVACASLVFACKEVKTVSPTQTIVVLDAEALVRTQAENLRVEVRSVEDEKESFSESYQRSDETLVWPRTLALEPKGGDASRRFEVVATAYDDRGEFVASVRAISGYVKNRQLLLRLVLEDDCIGVMCGKEKTCAGGGCVLALVDPAELLPFDAKEVPKPVVVPAEDAGLRDAGRDAGDAASVMMDGGWDAGSVTPGCEPNPDTSDEVCPEICPEVCNGDDDDCDKQVDEETDGTCKLTHAVGACVDGACRVLRCSDGWRDCDMKPASGCETHPNDVQNCGKCGHACEFEHATSLCVTGECFLLECEPTYADCDGDRESCETSLRTVTDCDRCGTECENVPHASAQCSTGECGPDVCDKGFGNCNSQAEDGCEEALVTLADCGACGSACDWPGSAGDDCATGVCVAGACQSGYADCDGDGSNGCESLVSAAHCGACDAACDAGLDNAASADCTGSGCDLVCKSGYGDCDANIGTGCESSLKNNTRCGACGTPCAIAHAVASCGTGACVFQHCDDGWGDCDTNLATGCESSLDQDTRCGSCNTVCGTGANLGKPFCAGGVCMAIDCAAGTADCNGDGSTCETTLATSASNCGACGNACAFTTGTPHASGLSCVASACKPACSAGYADCNGDYEDGCERSTTTLTDCGSCGTGCSIADATETCASGQCRVMQCDTDRGDCNNDMTSCETVLTTLSNCGACGTACDLLHAVETCGGAAGARACEIAACDSTQYADCDAVHATGCETNLYTTQNCGGCSNLGANEPCTNLPNVTTTSCLAGACAVAQCDTDWLDCDGVVANGCEQQLSVVGPCFPDTNCTKQVYGGKAYFFCTNSRSWSAARTQCQSQLLGDLVRIDDGPENTFVDSNIVGVNPMWTGASDQAVEGAWRWADSNAQFWSGAAGGSTVGGNYANWASAEPSDTGGEDCGELRPSDGKWTDRVCTIAQGFVCEVQDDLCPSDPAKKLPGQCGCGTPDTDTDGDGTANCNDLCPSDANKTAPGTCGCGVGDTDSDGFEDCVETCDNDPLKQAPGACGCGIADTDSDMDGAANCNETCDNDPLKTAPGLCGCSILDTNTDGDSQPDCNETCDSDPLKLAPGLCGCGTPDTNTDGDSQPDCNETCDSDPLKLAPGQCGCGTPDTDADLDGTANCNDGCPNDAGKVAPGVCGCGTADTDSDGDGTKNCNDGCPYNASTTTPPCDVCEQFTIDQTYVDADLTDFPVLVRVTDPALAAAARADGADIRFTSVGGALLDYEIESYTPATGALIAWVRLPIVSGSVNTSFRMHYGDGSAIDLSNPDATWEPGFGAVWHLKENPAAASSLQDSSGNARHQIAGGLNTSYALTPTTDSASLIGNGVLLNANDEWVSFGNIFTSGGVLTASVWWRTPTTLAAYNPVLSNANATISAWNLGGGTVAGKALARVFNGMTGTYGETPAGSVAANGWHQLAMVYDGAGATNVDRLKMYIDGAPLAVTFTGTIPAAFSSAGATMRLGHFQASTGYSANGTIDEVRISTTTRSPAWIKAEYESEKANSAFLTGPGIVQSLTGGFETLAAPYDVGDVDVARAFSFDPATSDVGNSLFEPGVGDAGMACNAEASQQDAVFKFTVPGTQSLNVELSGEGSGGNHVIALWNKDPTVPTTTGTATAANHDNRSLAANALGTLNDTWLSYTANMSTFSVTGVTTSTVASGNTDAIQDLGSTAGKQIRVTGGNSALTSAATTAIYNDRKLACGLTDDGGKDAIFKFTPSANSAVYVEVENASFGKYVSLLSGSPDPWTDSQYPTNINTRGPSTCGSSPCLPADCTTSGYSAGHLYYKCTTARTWTAARDVCASAGAYIPQIDDATENAFVDGLLAANQWVGAHDEGVEGTWRWVRTSSLEGAQLWTGSSTGAAIEGRYTNWDAAQPSATAATDDCAQILNTNGKWDDVACTTALAFACEFELPDTTTYTVPTTVGAERWLYGDLADTTNNYAAGAFSEATYYGGAVCTATGTAADAVWSFTLDTATPVTLSSAATGFNHTMSLWQGPPAGPVSDGRQVAENDTRAQSHTPNPTSWAQTVTVVNGTGSTLANQAVVIDIGATGGAAADTKFWAKADASGNSIRAYYEDGTELAYERAAWVFGTSAPIEVLIPSLTTGTHIIALHYGNASLLSQSTSITTAASTPHTVLNGDQLPVANVIGDLNGRWIARTSDTNNLTSGSIETASEASNNTDAVQTIAAATCGGDINVCSLAVSGGDTTSLSTSSDETYSVAACGADDAGRDALYKVTPTANTTLEVKLQAPSFNGVLAMFDGGLSPGVLPRTVAQTPTSHDLAVYRKLITVASGKVAENLTNFPVLVTLTGDAQLQSRSRTDGLDIRFRDAGNTTTLAFERVSFNKAAGKLTAWVKLPSLPTTGITFYMYYGDDNATDLQNASAVWDANFNAVWHLDDVANVADSKGGNTGTNYGASSVAGKVSQAAFFDSTDSISLPAAALSSLAGNKVTVSVWANGGAALPTQASVLFHAMSASNIHVVNGHVPWIDSRVYWDAGDGVSPCCTALNRMSWLTTSTTQYKGQWNHYAFTKDPAAGTMRIYLNGAQVAAVASGATAALGTATAFRLGSHSTGAQYFYPGTIDEFRVSRVERSAGWIKAEYDNQNAPTIFSAVGTEQAIPSAFESFTSFYDTGSIGVAEAYTVDPSVSDVQSGLFEPAAGDAMNLCNAEANQQDAVFKFTVPAGPSLNVEISAQGSGGNHVVALFDKDPTNPLKSDQTSSAYEQDTATGALADPIVAATTNGHYSVRSVDMASKTRDVGTLRTVSETPSTGSEGESGDNALSLDPVTNSKVTVQTGDTNLRNVDHSTMTCDTDKGKDAVYKFAPTKNGKVKLRVNPIGGDPIASPLIAVFNAAPVGAWNPSNINKALYSYSASVDLSLCTATAITFNGSTWAATAGTLTGCTSPAISTNQAQTSGGPNVDVLSMGYLKVPATTTITLSGTRPVVFAVNGNADVLGKIYANATNITPGPGGNSTECDTPPANAAPPPGAAVPGSGSKGVDGADGSDAATECGGGGGGGGGFGAAGGTGADLFLQGSSPCNTAALVDRGGNAGLADGTSSLVPLRGGCPGGRGGTGQTITGNAGGGGGAVQITVAGTLNIQGATITARGGGATDTGGNSSGGSGGGSGGGILLEQGAQAGTPTGLWANGGGGSQGEFLSSSTSSPGGDGSITSAVGGAGATQQASAGNGGSGGVCSGANCTPTQGAAGGLAATYPIRGGGGGGGAGGRIVRTPNWTGNGEFNAGAQVACTNDAQTTDTILSVTSGTTYYVVVASNANSTSGDGEYELVTEWADDWAGCNDDEWGPDAFVAFTTSGSTRNFTLDTQGSTADSVIALYNSSGTYLGCANDNAGGGTFDSITSSLGAGTYYVAIRKEIGAGVGNAVSLGIKDSTITAPSSLACKDGTSATGAIIDQALAPGTYYVAIAGRTNYVGVLKLQVEDIATRVTGATEMACSYVASGTAGTLSQAVTAGRDYYLLVKGDSANQAGTYTLNVRDAGSPAAVGCGAINTAGDAYYEFTLTSTTNVTIDPSASVAVTPAYELWQDVGADGDTGNDAIVGGSTCYMASQTYASLPVGAYYLKAQATTTTAGVYAFKFKDEAAVGAMDCVDGAAVTGGSISRTLQPGQYWAALTTRGGATAGDYRISIKDDSVATGATALQCGATERTQAVTAGTPYYVVVKGNATGQQGTYGLTITDVGTVPSFCGADATAPDGYFEFVLASATNVLVDIGAYNGSFLLYQDVGADGNTANDVTVGACQGSLSGDQFQVYTSLAAGTYYVKVKGDDITDGSAYASLPLTLRDEKAIQSLACDDGTTGAGDGGVIDVTLAPGTYYAAIAGRSSYTGALKLKVEDVATRGNSCQ